MAPSVNHKTSAADQHGTPPPSGSFEGVIVAILLTVAGIAVAYILDLSDGLRIAVMVLAIAVGAACGAAITRGKRRKAAKARAEVEAERGHATDQENQRKLDEAKGRGEL